MSYQERLLKAIPGGAHTYSRGYDQFPANAPELLVRGNGAYVYDTNGKRFLDYGMGLRAVGIGYSEEEINAAAIKQIENGNNLTKASLVELEAAEKLINMIDSAEMVKFTKNGSTAVSAAVKLARAYTGRNMVARCADHPFFSFDDWFIGSTQITKGVPETSISQTKSFGYNDLSSLERLLDEFPKQFACVVLEPAATEEPIDGFLSKVKNLCLKHGTVFILDEMITGFRWHLKGAQCLYNVAPDLCTFGKSMANGFSVACVAGRRDIMELGSIEAEGKERVFLLSTTHGAEMSSLGAFLATVEFMKRNNVVNHFWEYGKKLSTMLSRQAAEFGIEQSFKVAGAHCSPTYITLDEHGANSLSLRTLFSQEMIKNGVLMPWIALCYRHGENELAITEDAISKTFSVYRLALRDGVDKYLDGVSIKPVFRKYN